MAVGDLAPKEESPQNSPLDMEWVKLILIARALGFSKEDVRSFLQQDRTGNMLAIE